MSRSATAHIVNILLLATVVCWTRPAAAQEEGGNRVRIDADAWADNWFALYVNGELVVEDSVPYQTERSFNPESFSFEVELPARVAAIIKDYKEDDTGLEYIGRSRQQMGDGGFSAQFTDAATGELLAVSDDSWRCIAIHRAPLNRGCERSPEPASACESAIEPVPDHWMSDDFDDSAWPAAIVHSARDVRPHGGYDDVAWDSSAGLIWTEDLEIDNTILCRFTLAGD